MQPIVQNNAPHRAIIDNGFRFETFFMNQLVHANSIDHRTGVEARFKLVVNSIHKGERAGFYTDGNLEDYRAVTPARRCNNVDAINADARVLLIDALFRNGHLDELSWTQWRDVGAKFDLNAMAPTLMQQVVKRQKKMDIGRAYDILDQCFLATAPQIPGTALDEIRRERPRDPVAMVSAVPLGANVARTLAREVLLIAKMHQEGLLDDEQVVGIYDTTFRRVTGYRGVTDLSNDGGAIIANTLSKLQGRARATLWHDTMGRVGGVAQFGSDNPWPACMKPNPPKVCTLVQRFPVAAAFTTALIEHKQLDKSRATTAWEQVAMLLPLSEVGI